MAKKSSEDDAKNRLSAALRANLKRRKSAARKTKAPTSGADQSASAPTKPDS